MESFKNWRVCQICGRVTRATDVKGWLVSPRRYEEETLVIRCPAHISEWALRESKAGRTKKWRKIMKNGRIRESKIKRLHPFLEPFPLTDDLPEDMGLPKWVMDAAAPDPEPSPDDPRVGRFVDPPRWSTPP